MHVPFTTQGKLWFPAFALLLAACSTAIEVPVNEVSQPDETISESAPAEPQPSPARPEPIEGDPFEGRPPRFNLRYWDTTDFTIRSVDLNEISSGGPPPDGIPAIDNPIFENLAAGDEWLGGDWPVMFFESNGVARAYPLAILIHHEIVNDVVGQTPVTLTFCPLCNSTIAFDRRLADGTVLDFGTTGNLRNSDLVMYDRRTRSWWQQFTGEAIVGELTGTLLTVLPSQIIGWDEFKANHPDGEVLSRNTGHSRAYGRNPYAGYDTIGSNPFLFDGDLDGRLPAVERVVAIQIDGVDVAYPFRALSELGAVNDLVQSTPLTVFWQAGTRSTFGASEQDTGSTAVFLRELNGEILSFEAAEEGFRDEQTGSSWNIFGEAVAGPLAGSQLEQLVSAEHFWFAWVTFKPDTIIWQPPSA